MLVMKFHAPLLLLICLVFIGCGEEPAPAPPPAPEPAKPTAMTKGHVELVGLPDRVEPVVEIISVGFVPNRVYEMITRQQQALDAVLKPKSKEASEATQIMSNQDRDRFNARLDAIKANYPDRVTTNIYNDEGKAEPYISRESLYQRYKPLVESISVENFAESINDISAKMKADYELLQKLAEKPGEEGAQAKADINFLAKFSEYMQGYQNLVSQYDEARRKELVRQAQETQATQKLGTPEQQLERIQAQSAATLEIEVYKNADGSAYVEENGDFNTEGHGKLIIRVIMDGYSLFFVQDGPGDDYIEFTNLKKYFVEPEDETGN